MPRNIEIKARVANADALFELVQGCSDGVFTVINQEDTFFNIKKGKLKLRKILNEKEELIYYNRPDQSGPKLSDYVKVDRLPGELSGDLADLLSEALGVNGKVIKKRTLYMIGQTRVHLDEVKDLGNFVELEVVLSDEDTVEDGVSIAKNIMERLNIKQEDLLDCAYIDMLTKS